MPTKRQVLGRFGETCVVSNGVRVQQEQGIVMQMKNRRWLLVLAFMAVNYGAHSQTPSSQIVVPRPDIEQVVQAMSAKTCAGIVTGREKQVAAETNIKLLYKDKAISADDVAQILVMMHCT
jgi:hypothetical protein